eukprot:scaffold3091_cov117-Cylindrotheca_fusiformis.AAC.4
MIKEKAQYTIIPSFRVSLGILSQISSPGANMAASSSFIVAEDSIEDGNMIRETSKNSQATEQLTHNSSGGGSESRSYTESRSGSESGNDIAPHRQPVYVPPSVAKREEADVLKARGLVSIILLLAVAGVATTTNLLVKQHEESNFENKFEGYASEIIIHIESSAGKFFDVLDSFASSIGAQAAAEHALRNTSWPFYRVPQWSVQAEKLAQLTGIESPLVGFAPIVPEDERDEWRSFAAEQNPLWYQESIESEGYTEMTAQELVDFTIPFTYFYDKENFYHPTPVARPGEVVSYFQSYPIGIPLGLPLMLTNIDPITSSPETEDVYRITKAARSPALGFSRINIDTERSIPGSQMIQPIFDGPDTGADDRKMVAIVLIQIPWLDFLRNILSEGENGINVVVESACPRIDEDDKQSLAPTERNVATYLISGSDAVMLEEADIHDPKYDAYGMSDVFADFGIFRSQVPEGTCLPRMTLYVYPTAELQESLKTNNSVIYTVVVVLIFVFTTLVFLLYDYSVGKRQRTVMERIMKQERIVSDIFPTAIRDRIFENQAKNMVTGDADMLEDDGHLGLSEAFARKTNTNGSAPMADLFPSVTVIFADLVGFTAWSSAREPHHVFILLETIYGAFDKLAYRHGVFKVETVGDCYVAAVGLPEARADHALIACRFARECQKKMKDVILKLELTLGPDTSDLELRTGLHR